VAWYDEGECGDGKENDKKDVRIKKRKSILEIVSCTLRRIKERMRKVSGKNKKLDMRWNM
jgi:hypothetical protein